MTEMTPAGGNSGEAPEEGANDVIGTRPIPGARNEIVKLLLRHTKM